MDDSYVYVSVKLYLSKGQTEDSVQDVIQEMDYSFTHNEIISHEIMEIIDMQLPEEDLGLLGLPSPDDISGMHIKIDPFDTPDWMGFD